MDVLSAPTRIPRRVRRYILVYFTIAVALWASWQWVLKPSYEEQKILDQSFARASSEKGGVFGSNMRVEFAGMTQVKTMDSTLLPTFEDPSKRLIFVGDVHGCKDSLVELLHKMNFRSDHDHLVLTGDIVAKGPDSTGVIDFVMSLHASCVRGNHEDRVLLAYDDINSEHPPLPGPGEDENKKDDSMSEESFSQGDFEQRKVAKQLSKKQVEWLKECPVILNVGNIEGMGEVVVAHAGLVPGVAYEQQDPFQVMNMRTVDLETRLPSEDRMGVPWEKLWNDHQKRLPAKDRVTVIYGHDSKRGLNIGKYSRGLDTGCVKGGKLTALILESGSNGGVKERMVNVDCIDSTST